MIANAASAEEDDDALESEEVLLERSIIKIAKNKKRTAKPNVNQETTFSDPLSLVFAKTLSPPPVMAPEAPSDLPP